MATETGIEIEQEFKFLALGLVEESKTNPRKTFEPKALADLTASVKEKGVIVPILVRPLGATFEVVAGARRFRAAKMAGLDEIPAIIRQLNDDQALEAQVIENLQRADVHPLEEAEGYQALIAKRRYDTEMIAAKVGKSASYVYQRLKLLDLVPPAKKAFLEGGITAGHAVLIARLQPADQKEALGICASHGYVEGVGHNQPFTVGVRGLQDWIKNNILLSLDGAPWQKDDETLVAKAGSCDACPKRSGNAPSLWADIERPKICTDRACYQLKLNAHMENVAEKLEAEGKKIVKISTDWRPEEKGVLGTNEYYIAAGKKRCEKTVVGFHVDGEKRGKTADVCVNLECRIHKPKNHYSAGGSSTSNEDGKERERRIIKERATERARVEIYSQVLKKTSSLGRAELEILALNGNFGLPYVVDKSVVADLHTAALVAKATDAELARYLLGVAIGHQQLRAHGDAEILYRAAALRKLDVKAIEKEAARQVTQEREHHARRQAWKGRAAAGKTRYEFMTCQGCGRTEKELPKGGFVHADWIWVRKNDKNNLAFCSGCERDEASE